MEIDIAEILSSNFLILLFFVIGLGYLIGNIKLLGVPFGPTIGVLIAGLLVGHFIEVEVPHIASTFGFALFIFSVGIQAGPSFFSALSEDGSRYIALAVMVAVSAILITLGLNKLFNFDMGLQAGLLAGGLTSTPTIAAAQDAVRSGVASIPSAMNANEVIRNIGVGYAITYLVGTITIILTIRYLPGILGLDLPTKAKEYAKEKGLHRKSFSRDIRADQIPVVRVYKVVAEHAGKTFAQVSAEMRQPVVALNLRRGQQLLELQDNLELNEGDLISVVAPIFSHKWVQDKFGAEVLDAELLNYSITSQDIVVTNPGLTNKPLSSIELSENGCFAMGVTRSGVELPVSEDTIINRGDRLHITGEQTRVKNVAEQVGYIEEEVEETDLVTFSFGIVAGAMIGLVTFSIAGISLGIGLAGGLLFAGVTIGYLSSINPTFGRVPGAARFVFRELGLMILMAAIGLNAGEGFFEALVSVGPIIAICALAVSIVPIAMCYLLGIYIFKFNPALLLGAITGAMTSTPALDVVTKTAKSNVPAIGYAGTYAFANIFLTLAGTLIMML